MHLVATAERGIVVGSALNPLSTDFIAKFKSVFPYDYMILFLTYLFKCLHAIKKLYNSFPEIRNAFIIACMER